LRDSPAGFGGSGPQAFTSAWGRATRCAVERDAIAGPGHDGAGDHAAVAGVRRTRSQCGGRDDPYGRDPDTNWALTLSGRNRACDAFSVSRYLGPAPVSISDYTEQCRKQQLDSTGISQEELLSAMTGVMLDESTLTDLQLALGTGGSLLLTGQFGKRQNAAGQPSGAADRAVLGRGLSSRMPCGWTRGSCGCLTRRSIALWMRCRRLDATEWAPTMDARWRRVRRPVITVSTELSRESFEIRRASARGHADCTVSRPGQRGAVGRG
jgi:hypothetical protein